MTMIVNVAEIKAKLSEYLRRVEAGETIMLARRNQVIAELRPVASRPSHDRPFGLCRGEFEVPDDFNEPLPEEVLRDFEAI